MLLSADGPHYSLLPGKSGLWGAEQAPKSGLMEYPP